MHSYKLSMLFAYMDVPNIGTILQLLCMDTAHLG